MITADREKDARARRARDSASRSPAESSPILMPGGNAPESGFWSRWKTPLLVLVTCVAVGVTALGLMPVLSDEAPEEFAQVEGLPEQWQVSAGPSEETEPPASETEGATDDGPAPTTGVETQEPEVGDQGGEPGAGTAESSAGAAIPGGEEEVPEETGEPAPGDTASEPEDQPEVPPVVEELDLVADSLSSAMERYRERRQDFELNRLQCEGLTRGYRQVDEAYLQFLRVYDQARGELDASRRDAFQQLMEETDAVNRHFDGTRCPRPE